MTGIVLLVIRIIAALALYAFLGYVLLSLWKSLHQETRTQASSKVIPLDLIILSPDGDHVLHFSKGEISIGRDPECECTLQHSTVSARHARLAYHHKNWWIYDLLSTNGTNLNGEPLKVPTVITNGDTISCGQIEMKIIFPTEQNSGDLNG